MMNFNVQPLKIDHENHLIYMTEDQFNQNKCEIKNKAGYLEADGYIIIICLEYGKYTIPYFLIRDLLWQCIRGLQVMYYTHPSSSTKKEIEIKMAIAFRIYQKLARIEPFKSPIENVHKNAIEAEGLSLLKDILTMSEADRDALYAPMLQKINSQFVTDQDVEIGMEKIKAHILGYFFRTACYFILFDAETTLRKGRGGVLQNALVPGMFLSHVLFGKSETKAIQETANSFNTTADVVDTYVKDILTI